MLGRSALLLTSAFALWSCRGAGDTSESDATSGPTSTSTTTSTSSSSGAGGMTPTSLKIMDWNVHNFFDDTANLDKNDQASKADYAAHKKSVGAVVTAEAPDVVMFAEVENQRVLDELNAEELGSAYPFRKLLPGNDQRLINIALLSRVMPDAVISHRTEFFTKAGTSQPTYEYSRDCLEVHLTLGTQHVVLLGVHFRSKASPDDPDKRLAEAQHTRALADAIVAKTPGTSVLILGDFNDTPGSPPLNAISTPMPAFTDATSLVPMAARYSFTFMGMQQLIDHQVMSPDMQKLLDMSSVKIRHGSDVDLASDHAPIVATYRVP